MNIARAIKLTFIFIFVLVVYLFVRPALVLAGAPGACCGCGMKNDSAGDCDLPSGGFNCTSCSWCDPGEGNCPASTNAPQSTNVPTQAGGGQPTKAPIIPGCSLGQAGDSCSSGGGCCGGLACNGGVCGGGSGAIGCGQRWDKANCNASGTCEWQYVNTSCIADLGCDGNSYLNGDCWGFCPDEGSATACNNRNECIWSSPQAHPQGTCVGDGSGGGGVPTATSAPTTGTIRGNVFGDTNLDTKRQGGESFLSGVKVRLQIAGSSATAYSQFTSGNGPNYSFDNINAGTYEFKELQNEGAYDLIRTCLSITPPPSITVGRYFLCRNGSSVMQLKQWSASGAQNVSGDEVTLGANQTISVDFPLVTLTPTPPLSPPSTVTGVATSTPVVSPTPGVWMQIVGGSVYQPVIDQDVPSTENYLKNISAGDKSLGVLFANNAGDISLGSDPNAGTYRKVSETYTNTYNYEYFEPKLSGKATAGTNPISSSPVSGVYTYNGLSIDNTVNINPSGGDSVVYLVAGDLNINKNITLSSGKVAIFIVENEINVGTDVTRLDGVYIASGTFDASGTNGDLEINGMVYVDAFVQKTSDSDTDTPANKITYQPQFLLPLLPYLGKGQVTWQEVAP